jgi:Divergent InlB B-repeat domain
LVTRSRIAAVAALAGCFAAGLFAVGALGKQDAAAPPQLIVIDRSIGGIAIGSSQAQVTRLYGTPDESMPVTAGAGAGVLLTYHFKGGVFLVTLVGGRVVTIETTARYHQTDMQHGHWGPGKLFSTVQLPGSRRDQCSGGLWNGTGGKKIVTIVTRAGDRIASVWISLVAYYDLCASQIAEPEFSPPTETTAGPTGPFTLSVGATPSGLGVVISSPAGIGCPTDCFQDYPPATPVNLTATPSGGFVFDHWLGDCTGTDPTCTLTMNSSHSAVAVFSGTGPPYSQPTGTEAPSGGPPPATTGGSG